MSNPTELRHHYRACNLCEAICGLDIALQGDKILSIRGDKLDPLGRGYLCPKAVALQDLHNDPQRLRHPMRRTATGWERIGWKEAFDEVAARLKEIQRQHGRNAVGVYLGNPTVHNYGTLLFLSPFLQAVRSRNRFSATSLDQLPHMLASALMFGHSLLLPVPDIDRTDCFVIMGGNPAVSNGSLMTAPDIKNRLRELRQRGGKVIVIDPRRTETTRLADQHVFIRPGTDAVLLLAVLNVLRTEGLIQPGRVEAFLDGLARLWESLPPITPEQAAPVTGVEANVIRELARTFASAPRAVWYGRVGVCTQEFGGLTMWLIYVLNIVTGRLDEVGGAMFTRPAVDPIKLGMVPHKGFGRWKSRVRGLPEFNGELPAAVMAEEMTTPGEGQIRALVTIAGNPVLSSCNGKQLAGALAKLDFMVSLDLYVNETTRHAHLILPPTGPLEHENYDLVFHLLAIRNTARFSPTLFAPVADTRHEWEILLELQTRLRSRGIWSRMTGRVRRAIMRWIGPEGLLALGLRFSRSGLSLRQLKQHPHGIDLGPLEPCLPARLCTPSKRIALAPEPMLNDLHRLSERYFSAKSEQASLVLIGRRELRSNNSWMNHIPRLQHGTNGCTLLMHPDDAVSRGIVDGQRVRVSSRVGSVEVQVELTDAMMPGVVSLPHGWGTASLNDLTDERAIDHLSGNAAFSGTPVDVRLS